MNRSFLTVVAVMCLFATGCRGTQKCVTVTLEGPVYDSAPFTGKELKTKIEYKIDFDDRPSYDWR